MKNIIVFDSVHFTIKAEKLLKAKNLNFLIITTPREISSECGMSVQTDFLHIVEICKILDNNQINYKLYEVE